MSHVKIPQGVFNAAYVPYIKSMARTQIFYGGSSSGKSVFVAQRTVLDVLRGGRNYLVCRQVGVTLRKSVWVEIERVIRDWNVGIFFDLRKSDGIIECSNGYQILFTGLDDVEKLKSMIPKVGVITDIWIEEATEILKASLKLLRKRMRAGSSKTTKRITMTFNPILKGHWLFRDYFKTWADDQTESVGDDLTILKTTYKDNAYLTPDDIRDLENEEDKYYHDVYTLGNWGVLGNVIFTNWKIQDLSDMADQWTNLRNGGDFGYGNDPATLSRSHYDRKRKRIYIFAELYEHGLTNDKLAKKLIPIIGKERVIFDSAEPKSIQELRDNKVNAVPARKGKDSVIHGIQWLQQQTIIIDPECPNAINEFQTAKWKEDRGGEAIVPATPVDRDNHIIDPTRYAYERDMRKTWLIKE